MDFSLFEDWEIFAFLDKDAAGSAVDDWLPIVDHVILSKKINVVK